MMKVDLAEPLAPGKTATIENELELSVPSTAPTAWAARGALYELAQWYTRVAVYDDVRGQENRAKYLGQGEFYLDFGDYHALVTVAGGLHRRRDRRCCRTLAMVLTPPQNCAARRRREIRYGGDATITLDRTQAAAARGLKSTGMRWDVEVRREECARRGVGRITRVQWDASSWKGIMAYAYYRPSAAVNWHDAADQSRMSIMEYSERWFMYPWPHISAVEGPISGMEYP
jgi:hypothetical protein